MTILIFIGVLCLAYANGANDNFKGVATLFGSGTTNYRGALLWATITTFLGSLAALFFAGPLLETFSGTGLVEESLVTSANYGAAVSLGAGLTVLLATRIGMPVSTTHALVGALIGAGWAAGSTIDLAKLGGSFFLPLLASPLIALAATGIFYPLLHSCRRQLGIAESTCFCAGARTIEIVSTMGNTAAVQRVEQLSLETGTTVECRKRYDGRMLGIEAGAALDRMHYLSAGTMSFARGLNDTPKIAALLLLAPALGAAGSTALIGMAIAIGGVVSARNVGQTISQGITPMNHGQGFTANLITSIIVVGASRLGMPVSTTHVSCGSLFGIGAATGGAHLGMIGKILAAWITTLPVGAALGAMGYRLTSMS